jgi:molybdopterin converting factor small subunit
MIVRARLFGYLMVLAGMSDEHVELAEGSTLAGLVDELDRKHNSLARATPTGTRGLVSGGSLVFTVNRTHYEGALDALVLRDGDEIWLVPPLAGG